MAVMIEAANHQWETPNMQDYVSILPMACFSIDPPKKDFPGFRFGRRGAAKGVAYEALGAVAMDHLATSLVSAEEASFIRCL